jgi:hypothetical protein
VRVSSGTSDQSYRRTSVLFISTSSCSANYLVKIDDGLPELVLRLVEVPHADLSEVTRMVLVDVRSVMMLSTSHTTTTWMLPVLAYATVTSRDMATTRGEFMSVDVHLERAASPKGGAKPGTESTYCFLVFVSRVGILTTRE